jgi:hypothetical protein
MCVYTKGKTGVYTIPLTRVDWSNPDSSLLCCSVSPPSESDVQFIYAHSMHYFYLCQTLENWFRGLQAIYKFYWCHRTGKWFLEIFDDTVAVLYKLTWED